MVLAIIVNGIWRLGGKNLINNLRIGIPIIGSKIWSGGVTYIELLIKAVSALPSNERPKLLLVVTEGTIDAVELHEHILPLLDGILFFGNDIQKAERVLNQPFKHVSSLNELLKEFDFFYPVQANVWPDVCSASWIPDFQHIHLPGFFSQQELQERDTSFQRIAALAKLLVLSSKDAEKDFRSLYPHSKTVIRILSFHTMMPDDLYSVNPLDIQQKYGLPDEFLICSNQFWAHKNHILVFEAIAELKRKGKTVHLVCTGSTDDYRFPEYFKQVKQKITDLKINDYVHILGIIPRDDQLQLMRRALAVIQPSLFEGWSTVVEDARALGKMMFLSDLDVHKEQAPAHAVFFNKHSSVDLLNKINDILPDLKPGPDPAYEQQARNEARQLVRNYALQFCAIAVEAQILYSRKRQETDFRQRLRVEAPGTKEKLTLYFYKPNIDFILPPQFTYMPVTLLYGSPIEKDFLIEMDPKKYRFDLSQGWETDSRFEGYKYDPELFDIIEEPFSADFIVFPYMLEEMIQCFGIKGTIDFINQLPYFKTHEDRHVFMTNHDISTPFGISSIFFRASVNKYNKDKNAFAFPYPSIDYSDITHYDLSKLKYQTSFVGCIVSHPLRQNLMEGVKKESRLNSYLDPLNVFFPYLKDREYAKKRVEIFKQSLTDSLTILCPRSTGENSRRFFEAMSAGRIPIFVGDTGELPYEDEIDYGAFILQIPENEIHRAGTVIFNWLQQFDEKELLSKCKLARSTWEKYFKCSEWNKQIIKILSKYKEASKQSGKTWLNSGALIRFNTLYFQGPSKPFIKDYFTGEVEYSEKSGKWFIKSDLSRINERKQEQDIYAQIIEEITKINNLIGYGRFKDADTALNQALEKYPDSPDLLNFHAILKLHMKDSEGAKGILFDLIKNHPAYYPAYNNLACLYWDEGDFENATRYFEEALKIIKGQAKGDRQQAVVADYRSVVMPYGEMLMAYKKYKKAKELFEEYLKITPDDGEIKIKRLVEKCNNVLEKTRKLGGLVKSFQDESLVEKKFVDMEKSVKSSLLDTISRINKLISSNKLTDADIAIRRALLDYPDEPEILNLKAVLNIVQGNNEDARLILLDLVEKNDTFVPAYNNLAMISWTSGNFEDATKYFEKALRLSNYERSIVVSYGEMLMSYKKYARAKELFEGYLKANLDDSEVKSLLQKCENIIGKARKLGSIVQHRDAESSSA